MALIYKTLFEVKLLHEYYLTLPSGDTVFTKAAAADRMQFLADDFRFNLGSVNDDLEYDFPEELKEKYESLKIKIHKSYSGFKVSAEVLKTVLGTGTEVFTPKIPFPSDLNILVVMRYRNSITDSITNTRLRHPLNAKYFFSNRNVPGVKVFPFITNPVVANNNAFQYEQGELSAFAGGIIKKFMNDGSADPYRAVNAGEISQFVNESDRTLFPLTFHYSFIAQTGLTSAQFVLKDSAANVIKTIVSPINVSQKTFLSFNEKSVLAVLNLMDESHPGETYTLNVSGNNGYTAVHPVSFFDETNKNVWGLVQVSAQVANNQYKYFAVDGFLKRRNNPRVNAPVFELPITGRLAYFKYRSSQGNTLAAPAAPLNDYLVNDTIEPQVLITRMPQTISKHNLTIYNPVNSSETFLPHPESLDLEMDAQRRLCYEIEVPDSDLFPI